MKLDFNQTRATLLERNAWEKPQLVRISVISPLPADLSYCQAVQAAGLALCAHFPALLLSPYTDFRAIHSFAMPKDIFSPKRLKISWFKKQNNSLLLFSQSLLITLLRSDGFFCQIPKSQVSQHKACSALRDPGQIAESFLLKKQKETDKTALPKSLLQTDKPSVLLPKHRFPHREHCKGCHSVPNSHLISIFKGSHSIYHTATT